LQLAENPIKSAGDCGVKRKQRASMRSQEAAMELSTYQLIKYPTGQYVLLRRELKDPTNPALGLSSLMDPVGFYSNEDDARRAYERTRPKTPIKEG
jgi:hypothetical protein